MAREVKLPKLGQTMEEGTVVNCLVKVGDAVKKGDVIFEIETDKATLDMESPANGYVKHILVTAGQTLPVGTMMMLLGEIDEKIPQKSEGSFFTAEAPSTPDKGIRGQAGQAAEHPSSLRYEGQGAEKKPDIISPAISESSAIKSEMPGRIIATPRAKKIAEEMGVDLAKVTGRGPAGKITEEDVKQAAELKAIEPAEAPAEVKLGQTIALTKKQRLTAERMVESKREIPCFYLSLRADVTNLVELRSALNEKGEYKVSYNDLIIRAVAASLEKFPIMTGQLSGDAIKLAESINIGLAVSTATGLVVVVVKDANKKNLRQISGETQALIEKAQNDKLLLTDLEGACITISNLGAFGIESFIPVVIPGQCSILGIGRITDTSVPKKGDRKLMSMTLSVDHKVVNGDYAAQFLDYVRQLLENSATIL